MFNIDETLDNSSSWFLFLIIYFVSHQKMHVDNAGKPQGINEKIVLHITYDIYTYLLKPDRWHWFQLELSRIKKKKKVKQFDENVKIWFTYIWKNVVNSNKVKNASVERLKKENIKKIICYPRRETIGYILDIRSKRITPREKWFQITIAFVGSSRTNREKSVSHCALT